MAAPPSHYALVGSLWAELEDALLAAGAKGYGADVQINSLRRRLNGHAIRRLHYIRSQRNLITHPPHRPLSNPGHWERECRAAIRDLKGLGGRRPAGASSPAYRSRRHLAARRWIEGGRPWPVWAKAIAWGVGGCVVLTDESLTVMAALALMGMVCWSLFGPK